jgi:hypothetical protein
MNKPQCKVKVIRGDDAGGLVGVECDCDVRAGHEKGAVNAVDNAYAKAAPIT